LTGLRHSLKVSLIRPTPKISECAKRSEIRQERRRSHKGENSRPSDLSGVQIQLDAISTQSERIYNFTLVWFVPSLRETNAEREIPSAPTGIRDQNATTGRWERLIMCLRGCRIPYRYPNEPCPECAQRDRDRLDYLGELLRFRKEVRQLQLLWLEMHQALPATDREWQQRLDQVASVVNL